MEHGKGRRKFQNGARIRRTCVKKKKVADGGTDMEFENYFEK